MLWRQKSRELWLKEGDKNIGFFHKMANYHKRQSIIRIMKINGVWSSMNGTLPQDIVRALQDHLSDTGDWRANTDGLYFSRITEMTTQSLEAPFSMNEVHSALCDMNGDKAPESDNFTIAFGSSVGTL